MFLWWICWGESGLPILFLHHLRTASIGDHWYLFWLQQYVSWEIPDVQARFWIGGGTNDQIVNIHWIVEQTRELQKNIYFCFIDYTKAFDCVVHNKLWKILKVIGIPDDLSCLLRNLYAVQETTVRTRLGIMDWFHIGKGVCQGCILSPAYLTYMQSTSCKMPGWMKLKLESR